MGKQENIITHPKSLRTILLLLFVFMWNCGIPVLAGEKPASETLYLLIPDNLDQQDDRVKAWLDAAQEEGLKIQLLTDTQFLRAEEKVYTGLILPDSIHQRASDELIAAIYGFVEQGGNLMLVYDAGIFLDRYIVDYYPYDPVTGEGLPSRFSELVGIEYVMYSDLGGLVTGLGPVLSTPDIFNDLHVPPGKSMVYPGTEQIPANITPKPGAAAKLGYKVIHNKEFQGSFWDGDGYNESLAPAAAAPENPVELYAVSGYVYGYLDYYSYITRGTYYGTPLMVSPDFGLVAGVRQYGKGRVLFVNLPLTYLKGATDGMLMHGFLQFFGAKLLGMPILSMQPQGRGGLVLNWHVDDGYAIEAISHLDKLGVWDDGPFSIHFTAGPDVETFGDGLGMDLNNNPVAQQWIRRFLDRGHQVASHGGWIHNHYGHNANNSNAAEFLPLLELNREAIEAVTQRQSTEYSAPQGNNPEWALDWLQSMGVEAYYSTGHTGMAQTRNYVNGELHNPGLWAFPVSTFGSYATFEEFNAFGVTEEEMIKWYENLIQFVVNEHTNRLIYFHPPGAEMYPQVVEHLLDYAREFREEDQFSWYTMTRLADFMNQRDKVVIKINKRKNKTEIFRLFHPESLKDQTMILPKSRYKKPRIRRGKGRVSDDEKSWLVSISKGRDFAFSVGLKKYH